MNIEEYLIRVMDKDDKVREFINSSFLSAQMDNIKQMRTLIIQFVVVSSGIIGFTIPVLGRIDLVKSSAFLIAGLTELLIVVVYGFFYLTRLLQKENNGLAAQHKKHNDFLDKQKDARNNFLKSKKTEEDYNKWQDKQEQLLIEFQKEPQRENKPDYSLDIIFSAFFIGLVLLVLSVADFRNVLLFIQEIRI